MRGGLIFVFTIGVGFFALGLCLALAAWAGDPRFYLGDSIPPVDTSELDGAESEIRSEIAEGDLLIARLQGNLADLPVDAPATQRAIYEKRITELQERRGQAEAGLGQLDADRAALHERRLERLNGSRTRTVTRGVFLMGIGLIAMIRFREALAWRRET